MKITSEVLSSTAAAALLFSFPSLAGAEKKVYTRSDLPQEHDWVGFGDGSSFMPAADPDLLAHMRQQHQKRRSMSDSSSSSPYSYSSSSYPSSYSSDMQYMDYFVDGSETFWSEGAQAWRLVGYYIDCYNVETGYKGRRLSRNLKQEDQVIESNACLRYLLWAAYVDVEYEGNGIGEYQYWNSTTASWDTSACDEMGGSRCAKMDCHVKQSDHFKLLGFFKEPNFGQFYEQLFKHQGVCLWGSDEYSFMQNMRELWPKVCTFSGVQDEKSNNLYFDLKPTDNGDVSLGLYTDERCSVDYTGNKKKIDEVIEYYETYGNGQQQQYDQKDQKKKNKSGSMLDLVTYMSEWNEAMEIYKQCQPCKAYNLHYEYTGSNNNNNNNYNYNYNNANAYYNNNGDIYYYNDDRLKDEDDDYSDDDSKGHFKCYDDAGYTNVNQCMKFATHTKLMAATFRDVMIGASQGTIKDVYVGHISVHPGVYMVPGTNWRPQDFVAISVSCVFFLTSAFMLFSSWKRMMSSSSFSRDYRERLVD